MATAAAAGILTRWEAVIGLEVHCQLKTATKIFCACANRFGDEPNTLVCPVCLGLPGALPVLNRHAVTLALRAALATHGDVQPVSIFARKNYFYPDLPKGYQISQYEQPLSLGGWVEIPSSAGGLRRVGLARIHMEEDAGKLLHEGFGWSREMSGVDFNRSGVPLIEIVSRPELHSPDEAYEYLTALRALLLYAEVSDCNMEEGSLRCDANVSVRPRGRSGLGTRAEVKNLNSFRNVARAVEYEIARQATLIEAGGEVVQETRLWDDARGLTAPMRSKEEAHDYRYFPEPDLPPLVIAPGWLDDVRASLPELPPDKRRRFTETYGLSAYDAGVLTQSREVADYFERVAGAGGDAKAAANWVANELLGRLNDSGLALAACRVTADHLAQLIRLIGAGTISGRIAKDVFARMWDSGDAPGDVVEREGLVQVSDESALQSAVAEVVAANPLQVETYRAGKTAALGWFVGQVMRKTGGKANPQLLQALLKRALDG